MQGGKKETVRQMRAGTGLIELITEPDKIFEAVGEENEKFPQVSLPNCY